VWLGEFTIEGVDLSNIQAVRRIQFCSGHRVLNHESKCANLHGHNYVAMFYAEADDLDKIGRVIDFSVLKEKIGGWIDQHWDHTTLLFCEDRELLEISPAFEKNKKVFICDFNPTAENMAEFLLHQICPEVLADTPVVVTKVELWETENCKVEVSL
jgi:6-pyruvoyltetrahydropterin/6-carboxytetrahydropterin synthase